MSEPVLCPTCGGDGATPCDCWPGACSYPFGIHTCMDCNGSGLSDDADCTEDVELNETDRLTREPKADD